jgi:hypothetical protein
MDLNPPTVVPSYQDNPLNGPIYPSSSRRPMPDGNEIAGVRLPELAVPLNTYTRWALRAARHWAKTTAAKSAEASAFRSRPRRPRARRPAIRGFRSPERYPTFLDYYYKVTQAINDFVAQRFLLAEDAPAMANRMLNAGFATGAIKMAPDDADE